MSCNTSIKTPLHMGAGSRKSAGSSACLLDVMDGVSVDLCGTPDNPSDIPGTLVLMISENIIISVRGHIVFEKLKDQDRTYAFDRFPNCFFFLQDRVYALPCILNISDCNSTQLRKTTGPNMASYQ